MWSDKFNNKFLNINAVSWTHLYYYLQSALPTHFLQRLGHCGCPFRPQLALWQHSTKVSEEPSGWLLIWLLPSQMTFDLHTYIYKYNIIIYVHIYILESCEGLKRTSDAAIQCGYQRRTRELADWARSKKRRMIRREDLLAYLAGKPLPTQPTNPHANRRWVRHLGPPSTS